MRQNFASGGPWEERFGYARAVAAGAHLWVSGCTSVVDGEVAHVGDAAAQMRTALAAAADAIERAGFSLDDVVRTRMYVVDVPRDGEAVGTVHGEVFAEVRPATAMVGVAALLDPRMLVEVEVECCRDRS
jgi:enamine deaminase RidA (YjgF/YER057c/UK114 family)